MALVRELNRGCGRILGWGALATTLVTVVGSASGDSTYRITAEVGPEVDSNALRASSGICVPRQEVVCLCPDGNQSVQECLADGTGFGPCRACPADSDPGMVASGLMRLVADGEVDPEAWGHDDRPAGELRREMLELPGVGPYVAENLLKLLGRPDGLALDSWMRAKYARLYHEGRKVRDRTIARRYRAFGPWAGLAVWCDLTRDWFEGDEPSRAWATLE